MNTAERELVAIDLAGGAERWIALTDLGRKVYRLQALDLARYLRECEQWPFPA
jgi:hypothetical protein